MRPLPPAASLQEAVEAVIDSNKQDGYVPGRFIQLTEGGHAKNLLDRCIKLIESYESFAHMVDSTSPSRIFLTLEDYVARFGADWGFPMEAVTEAKNRVDTLDKAAGGPRFH